jgi:hypothetical protein
MLKVSKKVHNVFQNFAGEIDPHFVFFQRLDSCNEIPSPLSIGLSAASGVYFPLEFGIGYWWRNLYVLRKLTTLTEFLRI